MAKDSKDGAGGVDRRAALGLMAGPMVAAAAAGLPAGAQAAKPRAAAAAKPAPASDTSRERVYTHEFYDLTVKRRRAYLDWFSSWPAKVRAHTNGAMRNFGVWGTIGMTHRWAEGLVMWEYPSKQVMADGMRAEWAYINQNDAANSHYQRFWDGAPEGVVDTQGMGRTMVSTAYSPTLEELIARKVKPIGYMHLDVTTRPGGIHRHLKELQEDWLPIAARMGLQFIGAWRTLFVDDDQGVVLWGFPDWRTWANFEDQRRTDPEALMWRSKISGQGVTWDGRGMIGARADPLRSGKIL